MKTSQLISLLASDAAPVQPLQVHRRFLGVLGIGAVLVLFSSLMLFGVRPDLPAAAKLAMFWWKLAFPLAIAGAALLMLRRLGYPGVRLGRAPLLVAVVLAFAWGMSVIDLFAAEPTQRQALLFGRSWIGCVAAILVLSLPAAALAFSAVRRLAPTRPMFTGAAAGLFGGACAAFSYSLYCTEMQLPFVAVWYGAGMLLPAALGAFAGGRVLRW